MSGLECKEMALYWKFTRYQKLQFRNLKMSQQKNFLKRKKKVKTGKNMIGTKTLLIALLVKFLILTRPEIS